MTDSAPRQPLYYWGVAAAIAGAILFSAKAILVKLLYQAGSNPDDVIGLRMLLSLPFFLAIWLYCARQTPRLTGAEIAALAGIGTFNYFGSSYLDFIGLQYISAGLERLLLYMSPSFVLLLNLSLHQQKITRVQLYSLALAYLGIALVFWRDVSLNGANVWLGSAAVLACAMIYAVYFVFVGKRVERVGSLRLVGIAMTAACVFTLSYYAAVAPSFTGLFVQTPQVWWLSFIHATLSTVLPVFLVMYSVKILGANVAAQTGMIGPVSTLFLAAYFLAEPITLLQAIGTVLVLAGIFLLTLKGKGQ